MSDRPDISDNSWAGDPYSAEGAIEVKLDGKNPRQDVPGSKNVQHPGALMGNMYEIGGINADSGQVFDGQSDNSRQAVPSPDIQGGLNADGCGIDVDFAAQAPVKYEFPKDSITVHPPPHPLA